MHSNIKLKTWLTSGQDNIVITGTITGTDSAWRLLLTDV